MQKSQNTVFIINSVYAYNLPNDVCYEHYYEIITLHCHQQKEIVVLYVDN